MSDELERTDRLLDDLAAERDPRDRAALTPEEAELAETAALLKLAHPAHGRPDDAFVERLGAQLAAMRGDQDRPQPTPDAARQGLSRRGLLGRLAATAAGVAVGAGGGAVVAYDQGQRDGYRQETGEPYTVALVPEDRGQWLPTGHTHADVVRGKAVRFRAGAVEGFLVDPGEGRPLYALSAACTHMGCLISWLDSADTFLCPCHGAQYTKSGAVLSGIARHPLPRLRLREDDHGHIYVWGVVEHPATTTVAPYNSL